MGSKTNDGKAYWNRKSKSYSSDKRKKCGKEYQKIYQRMQKVLFKDMDVLEVATGTGLVATNIAERVRSVKAMDYAEKMIEEARINTHHKNVEFFVGNATVQSDYPATKFDVAIIMNALYLMAEPKEVLALVSLALKPKGLLVAPSFLYGHMGRCEWWCNKMRLKLLGCQVYWKWTQEEFANMIESNFDDCRHIVAALISGCEIIVSWNFNHMVNVKTIKGAKAIALLGGYRDIMIYAPSSLI